MGLPKLLITGSSGRIGTILMTRLADVFELFGVDLCISKLSSNQFRADVSNYEQISNVLSMIAPLPYIVHLAGNPRVDADWQSVLKNNIIGTRKVYEAAKQFSVKRVVFASSNHVTGAYEGFPSNSQTLRDPTHISIQDPIRPDSDYGTSKAFGEAVARQYYEVYGIESVCLRIGFVHPDNDPTKNDRLRSMWLSHKDLVQLIKKSIFSDVKFGIYYGVSDNKNCFWDISNARDEIDYQPEDDASKI
ncbi:MAG TPA: NAD(P)-dependent oxidoreductase [bacterium]|nr:NAD(P)-dependent oxidoreductase [bacterium]